MQPLLGRGSSHSLPFSGDLRNWETLLMKSLGVPESQLITLRDVDALQGRVGGAARRLLPDGWRQTGHGAQTRSVTTNAGGNCQGPGALKRGPGDCPLRGGRHSLLHRGTRVSDPTKKPLKEPNRRTTARGVSPRVRAGPPPGPCPTYPERWGCLSARGRHTGLSSPHPALKPWGFVWNPSLTPLGSLMAGNFP